MQMSLWEYQALIAGYNKANSSGDEIEQLGDADFAALETLLDDFALTGTVDG